MFKSILNFLYRMMTARYFKLITTAIGFFLLFSMKPVSPNSVLDIHQKLLFSTGFFFCGLAGIPEILGKDANFGLFRATGRFAVIYGLFIMVGSFCLALLPLLPPIIKK